MMMPSIFRENLFDDFMNDFAFPAFPNVDIVTFLVFLIFIQTLGCTYSQYTIFQMHLDLIFCKSRQINIYFISFFCIFHISLSRSFYVGEYLTEEDIHPKYENGILSFVVPKEEEKPVEEKSHYITIE